MLDAGAAAAAAKNGLQAVIDVSPIAPSAGAPITLSGTGSLAATGHTIVGYQWALVDGGGIVTPFGATNATASVTPTAAGHFAVSLTITDDAGNFSTYVYQVEVAAAASTPPAPPPSLGGGGGGGGGALGAGWLLMLAVAVAALRRTRPT